MMGTCACMVLGPLHQEQIYQMQKALLVLTSSRECLHNVIIPTTSDAVSLT